MLTRPIVLAMVLVGAVASSCARGTPQTPATRVASTVPSDPDPALTEDTCPMSVAGTVVISTNVERGAAFVFSAPGGDVAELRRRVRVIARLHEDRPMTQQTENMMAATEDIEGGARLTLRPRSPDGLDVLRDHVQITAQRLARGECTLFRTAPSLDRAGQLASGRAPRD